MAVRVRATDIEDEELPPVCVVTGQPATATWNVRYLSPIGALWLLLLFGVLPFVIARYLTRQEVAGGLPIAEDGITRVKERRRARHAGQLVALLVAVAAVAVAVAVEHWLVAAVGLLVALVEWLVVEAVRADPVYGEVERNGRWVRLVGAHPAFAEAVARDRAAA